MKILKTTSEIVSYLRIIRAAESIGFVPTMGALHSGHLKLVKESKKECKITICSIFVNPTQFNNPVDLANYPKTLDEDLAKLKKLDCDIAFTPTIDDLYDKEEKTKEFNFGKIATTMEGKSRPGHFNGVATIIEKLFQIITPTQAFFGQKDLQQLQIIKALVKQMKSPINIVGVPTVREKNGLAKSSRNLLLSENYKNEASLINDCLQHCRINKEKGVENLKVYIREQFKNNKNFELDYSEIVSLKTMLPINKWQGENKNAICIAAFIGGVRLIDNILL